MKKNSEIKVCHFTSAHEQLDDRIYLKECISLTEAGYNVYIVGKGENRKVNNIHIVGCGEPKNRWERMMGFSRKIYLAALELECDIYHFHDPELLPYGIKLKKAGKKVIFDSHEDVPAQILDKVWIPRPIRKVCSVIYKMYETYAVGKFDAVVTATAHIAEQFTYRGKKITVINNYPKLDDILFHGTSFRDREPIICYAGGISEVRGERVMLEAIEKTDAVLYLAGPWKGKPSIPLSNVKYLGKISREEVNNLYGKSMAGILLYQPAKNHFESQPIKMFEYMAAGLPVICSDFKLWTDIVEGNKCGICVNPQDNIAVAKAISTIISNSDLAEEMGKAGYAAVRDKYNWVVEEKKLLELYREIEK